MFNLKQYLTIVSLSLLWPLLASADSLQIHVLDVGEGQAVLLHKNQRAILIDTGHAGMAQFVLQRLRQLNIDRLDYLILTHLHPDHASGYFRIQEAHPQANIIDNCHPVKPDTTPDMVRWIDQALQKNSRRQCLYSGDEIDWAGTRLSVLSPDRSTLAAGDLNHNSLVLLITHKQQQLLVMGDADKPAESRILQQHSLEPVDILVVGHHGSKYASSDDLLATVRPRHAIISTNRDNFRGYPSPETLLRLQQFSENIYKTYEQGEIQFSFD